MNFNYEKWWKKLSHNNQAQIKVAFQGQGNKNQTS